MSAEERGFVAAICADPADDTARLVYADWLQENGQPERAEFIRWQVATGWKLTATGGPCVWSVAGPIGRRGLVPPACWRAANTFLSHPTPKPFTITRGFVSHLTCTAEDWLAHADALHWHPGQTVATRCEECNGSGLVAINLFNPGGFGGSHRRCHECDGSGMVDVPRPCPATAQPLDVVTLTTLPNRDLSGFHVLIDDDRITRVTHDRWPGIEFHLPTTRLNVGTYTNPVWVT